MNKICTSLEQSKKLIELGIDVNTADFMWEYNPDKETYWNKPTIIPIDDYIFVNDIPAWSFTALFKMLPYSARIERGSSTELYCVTLPDELKSSDWYIEPIDAAFEMVVWLKETNRI